MQGEREGGRLCAHVQSELSRSFTTATDTSTQRQMILLEQQLFHHFILSAPLPLFYSYYNRHKKSSIEASCWNTRSFPPPSPMPPPPPHTPLIRPCALSLALSRRQMFIHRRVAQCCSLPWIPITRGVYNSNPPPLFLPSFFEYKRKNVGRAHCKEKEGPLVAFIFGNVFIGWRVFLPFCAGSSRYTQLHRLNPL